MNAQIRPPAGIDPILDREAEVLSKFVDRKVESGQQITFGRVYTGCDGQEHVQIAGGATCCSDCPQSGTLVPVFVAQGSGVGSPITTKVPPVFGGTAGQPTITSGGSSGPLITVAPCSPTFDEMTAARRLQDSAGNLWNGVTGAWISAGNGTPALVASHHFTSAASEIPNAKIWRDIDSFWKNIFTESPRKSGARPPGRSFSYAVRDYALAGICTTTACGKVKSTQYVFSVEYLADNAYLPDLSPQKLRGVITCVRDASTLELIEYQLVLDEIYDNTGGADWAIDVAPDGTWIVHAIPQSGPTATVRVYRYMYTSEITFLGYIDVVNDNSGGKASAAAGLYFKQVA